MKPCSAIAHSLLLAIGAQAQDPDCGWWNPADCREWKTATVERVTACLNAGVDVNARGDYDRTPLHQAARFDENPAVFEAIDYELQPMGSVSLGNVYHTAFPLSSKLPELRATQGQVRITGEAAAVALEFCAGKLNQFRLPNYVPPAE